MQEACRQAQHDFAEATSLLEERAEELAALQARVGLLDKEVLGLIEVHLLIGLKS